MHITKLLCPHCHAVLKSSEAIAVGTGVNCTHCQAPFTVSAVDLVKRTGLDAEPVSGILEPPRESTASLRMRAAALMSTPYLPPPMPKDTRLSMPAPAPRRGIAPIVTVILGLTLLAVGGIWATWFGFDGETATAKELTALPSPSLPGPSPPAVPQSPKNEIVTAPAVPKAEVKPAEAKPAEEVPVAPKEPAAVKPTDSPPPPLKVAAIRPVKPAVPAKPVMVLAEAEQKKVDAAIDKGVRYLKSVQQKNGTWLNWGKHVVGYAALAGLTLLECDTPTDDPAVKKAAAFVRTYTANLNQTYDLSLAILFLDRLGDRKDRALIQQLAVRLVAGQSANGGWTYECPILTNPEKTELLTFLRITRPEAAKLLNPLPVAKKSSLPNPLRKDGGGVDPLRQGKGGPATSIPLARVTDPNLPAPLRGKANQANSNESKLIQPIGEEPLPLKKEADVSPKGDPASKTDKDPVKKPKNAQAGKPRPALRLDQLSQRIRTIRVVLDYFYKGKALTPASVGDDNSNSQFAMLALWAARRHDVPTERVLALSFRRFQQTQNDEGGWNYQIGGRRTMAAMTGVGLLGLAMGHATSDEGLRFTAEAMKRKGAAPRPAMQDPAIHKGLEAFGKYIGEAQPGNFNPPMANLYFLWTVERVAMLYNLKTIAGKDWYRWGVHVLLPHQNREGSWFCGQYPGSDLTVDTCFALLFLKRSNLVRDLTENLTFYLAITDSDARRSKNK